MKRKCTNLYHIVKIRENSILPPSVSAEAALLKGQHWETPIIIGADKEFMGGESGTQAYV